MAQETCQGVLQKKIDDFSNVNFDLFTDLIKSLTVKNHEIEKFVQGFTKKDKIESVAKRLMTGIASEAYFKLHYKKIPDFTNYELKDTTNFACGFDFKLSYNHTYYCIEVKGLNTSKGGISLTEKEFEIAKLLKKRYCLFIVSNFVENPIHQYYFDPLNSGLKFKKTERSVIQINYSTTV